MGDGVYRCRICKGWSGEGRSGEYFGRVIIDGMVWAIVRWEGQEDPDLFKSGGIEIAEEKWIAADLFVSQRCSTEGDET